MIHTQDADFTLYQGDALDCLREIAYDSIHCVVTSPPYWNLRDYGTGEWEGGEPDCPHIRPSTNYNAGFNDRWGQGAGERKQETASHGQYARECRHCGAIRVDRQLGLEQTLAEYVARLVAVFGEVKRVLRADGTVWLNLGDSYLDKNLVGMPWTVALALKADGWLLRSDIVWDKPNAMPESITDRPTSAHEYLFLLAKSQRYYFDAVAVREPYKHDGRTKTVHDHSVAGSHENHASINGSERWPNEDGRNIRTVWTIPTQPYPGAHFAVFPDELARRCIVAGCPEGGTVLDPFMGSGTTAFVARAHGRRSVGIELSPEYCDRHIRKRTQQQSLFA